MKLVSTMLIHKKDDIEFVTEFPCLLGHPVVNNLRRSGGLENITEFGLCPRTHVKTYRENNK